MLRYRIIRRNFYLAATIIFLQHFFGAMVTAQDTDTTSAEEIIYYTSLRDQLSLYTYGIVKFNTIEMSNAQGLDLIRYKPNENLNIGLGFNYKWMGIGTAMNFHLLNSDDHLYGKTQSFDLQGDIYMNRTIFTVDLQGYNGFYWENVGMYDTTWNTLDSVPLRPDISTVNIGISGFYINNPDKFSFKSVYTNTEWQKHSAGSLLYGGHLSLYGVSSDSYLVPGLLWDAYPTYDSLVNLSTISVGFSMGYAYTYVFFEKFYLHATLLLGVGLQFAEGDNGAGEQVFIQAKPSGRSHIRLAMGVNNEDYYYGISLVSDNYPVKNEIQSSFIYRYGKIRFFYGMHMDYNALRKNRRKKKG